MASVKAQLSTTPICDFRFHCLISAYGCIRVTSVFAILHTPGSTANSPGRSRKNSTSLCKIGMSTLSVDKPIICIECQKWVVHLNSTKSHDIIPWQQDHLIPAPNVCHRILPSWQQPSASILWLYWKLISPTLLSLSLTLYLSLCSPFYWYFMSLSLHLSLPFHLFSIL